MAYLPFLLKALPSVLSWVLYMLAQIYPETFPAVSALTAGLVTAANVVPSPVMPRR